MLGIESLGLESLLRPRVTAGLEVSLKPLTQMIVGIVVLIRRSELPCQIKILSGRMSRCRRWNRLGQWTRKIWGTHGRSKRVSENEEVRVGAVESGNGRQRQASSCAVSSCILGRRTASATVVALDSPGSQRFAASFTTPEEESCMQWDALWPKRVQELQYSAAHGVGQGVGSAAKHFSQTSVRWGTAR